MNYPVDLNLLRDCQHMPSVVLLERSMNRNDLELLDFCIPVNSYFPTSAMLTQLLERMRRVVKFYPAPNQTISEILATSLGLPFDNLVVANGSTEIIAWITQLWVADSILTPIPTFGRWTDYPLENGLKVHTYQRMPSEGFDLNVERLVQQVRHHGCQALALCNPNNPTGNLTSVARLSALLDELSDLDVIVIDESFLDFASLLELPTLAQEAIVRDNVIVIKSLGKNLGLHGVRAGYAVTNTRWARRLRNALPAWNVNALAESVIEMFGEFQVQYEQSRQRTIRDRESLQRALGTIPELQVYSSHANFVLARLSDRWNGVQVRDRLLREHGCLLRECGSKLGSDCQYFRIAAKPRQQTERLVRAMKSVLGSEPGHHLS